MVITNRSKLEEMGISTEIPVRARKESETYWNTRFLAHSILGKHYKTPQFNMQILAEFLNSQTSQYKRIDFDKSKFDARGSENLKFFTQSGIISFEAHKSINKTDFLKEFDL
jgi:predicted RNA-binding protein Jag